MSTGCTDSTQPENTEVEFVPETEHIALVLDQNLLFLVRVQGTTPAEYSFLLNGTVVATLDSFRYFASEAAVDTLRAEVQFGEGVRTHIWVIDVDVSEAQPPPPVLGLTVANGDLPSSFSVSWLPPDQSGLERELEEYEVRIDYTLPPQLPEWDSAQVLETVAHDPHESRYLRDYDAAAFPAIRPGQHAWLAVRIRDRAGLISPLGRIRRFRITAPYWLSGTVRDETGGALNHALIEYGCDTCRTYTQADGSFSVGPFRDIDSKSLVISDDGINNGHIGSYYDFVTEEMDTSTTQPLEFRLLPTLPLDAGCPADSYRFGFLEFFRSMSRTNVQFPRRENYELLKWERYPLKINVEATRNSTGEYSLDSLACVAIDEWNEKLGETYFTVVPDPAVADVEVVFADTDTGEPHGVVNVVVPGGGYALNEVIPQRVNMRIKRNFPAEYVQYMHEVLLHELGHVLWMGSHSACGPLVHIMYDAPAGMIDAYYPEIPISDVEALTVHCIRYLPQGLPMDRFRAD